MAKTYTSEKIYDSVGEGRNMYVTCRQVPGSSSENKSTIYWTLVSTGGTSNYFDTGPTNLVIAGAGRYWKERTYWSSYAFPAAKGEVSGSFIVSHKEDGSIDPITVSLSTAIHTSTETLVSGSWTLDSIARYFSSVPTLTLTDRTETSLNFSWSTSEDCKKIVLKYKKSNETTYTEVTKYENATGAKEGTFDLTGLTAGTAYNISIIATRKDSGLTSTTAETTFSTYDYPYCTETPNFTIGNEVTLKFYNPLNRAFKFYLIGNGTQIDYEYSCSINSYTGLNGWDTTVPLLYATIPNAQSAQYSIKVVYGSSTKTTSNENIYTIKKTEVPTFSSSNVSTYDSSTSVTAVTGQTGAGGWLVQSLSQLKVTIPTAATPKNSATISKYEVTFAGVTKTLTVGNTGAVWDTLNSSGTKTVSIKVTDSRGLSTTVTKDVIYKPYNAPTIVLTGGRENNYGTKVLLTVAYTSSSVEGKNKISSTWSGAGQSGTIVAAGTSAISANTTVTVNNVNNNNPYTFTATITDSFSKSASASLSINIGVPIFFTDEEQLGVGVNTFPSGQGLYVNGQTVLSNGDLTVDENELIKKNLTVNGTSTIKGNATFNGDTVTIDNNLNAGKMNGWMFIPNQNPAKWMHLGDFVLNNQGSYLMLNCCYGNGQNGIDYQQVLFEMTLQKGQATSDSVRNNIGITVAFKQNYCRLKGFKARLKQTSSSGGSIYIYMPSTWNTMVYEATGNYTSYTKQHTALTEEPTDYNKEATIYSAGLESYPINSIYMSVDSTSPAELFGGSWERLKDKFLLGAGDEYTSGNTGGEKEVTLTVDQMPGHSHSFAAFRGAGDQTWSSVNASEYSDGVVISAIVTNVVGGGQAHNNMPPYLVVYMWKRIG